MATTLSHFPQSSSPSNPWLSLSDASVNMAGTTMVPADLAPAERAIRVGWRFHPTDQELIGHYLLHKLKADDLSFHETIPEIGVCKGEPWDLLDWATSASSAKFDESQCFFFSPRDYKYSNSNRSNRATLRGFWKVTGRDRKITSKDTNKVIGTKKTLVYHERHDRGIKTNWVIHEYHDAQLSSDQRTHVLCWLRKDNKKKTKEKNHQPVDNERRTINPEGGNLTNIPMNSEEHYFSNRGSMVQGFFQSNEAIDSMIQTPFGSNEAIDSMIQTSPQSNEIIDSRIQTPFGSNEAIESMIQTSPQSNEIIDSRIQTPFGSNEAIESMIQTSPQSNEVIDSRIQTPFGSNEAIDSMIQTSPQSNEAIDPRLQIPFGSNEVIDSMIQTSPQSEAIDSMIQIPVESNEAIDSMSQTSSQSNEVIGSMIQKPFGLNEAMIQTSSQSNSMKPTIQPDEPLTSMSHILSSEPNSIVETSLDASEFGFSIFDLGEFDFTSLWQSPSIDEQGLFGLFDSGETDFTSLLQSPWRDGQGLFEMMATSDMRCHEA